MSRIQAGLIGLLISFVLPSQSAAQGLPAPGPAAPPAALRGPVAAGQPSWRQDFEGPNTSWTEAGGDAQYSLVAHQRVRGGAHGGQGSEWLQVVGQGGSTVLVAHDIGRPWVIDELRTSIWIYADRPGIQVLAEVTLPRSHDPRAKRTDHPLTTNVFGTAYTAVGRWQRLEIVDIPRKLADQVRVLRSQLGPYEVDAREAYVSRVLLNVYGGPGVTNVWTDDLEVFGHVPSVANDSGPGAGLANAADHDHGYMVPATGLSGRNATAGIAVAGGPPEQHRQDVSADHEYMVPAPPREVKLAGSVLKVNEYPIFPRSIEYRGERLAFLKQLGFNTIWLREKPSPALLSEARQLGLWLVCPPPEPPAADPQATIGPEFEPVLVWDLGHGLTGESLDAARQRAERVRLADARFSRPLIGAPINNLRSYSRNVINLLLIDRRPLGTSLQMPDYGEWVNRQPFLALPGTPVWTTVQTQVGEGLRRQLATLAPGQAPPTVVAPEQIRLLVYTAISSGSRGLLFLSDSSLEAQDGETRQRVAALALLNLELQVIEPWAAGGSIDAMADCTQKLVSGAILRDHRARIVMPIWLAPGSQCVAPEAAAKPLNLTLLSIPESENLFELTAGRLEPLRHRRVAGGTQVTLDEFGLSSLLFLAQDPMIIDAVTRRTAVSGRETAELEHHLAVQKLDTVVRVLGQIGRRMPLQKYPAQGPAVADPNSKPKDPAQDFDTARQNLKLCADRLATGDYAMASAYSRRAMMPLRKLERTAWETAMSGRDSPVTIPGTSSFTALPWYWALVDRIAGMRPGRNLLPGGDFENIQFMVRDGWRHFQHVTPGIQTTADLVPEAAHSGRLGLRLTARADDPQHAPKAIEMPPLWVTSPAVPVAAGQIVWIHGWVNIPTAIAGSVDGLLVVESLTGEEMALRLDKTAGWQEFSMLRIVPQSGPLALTLAMTGLGEVRLDDLTIEVLESGIYDRGTAH